MINKIIVISLTVIIITIGLRNINLSAEEELHYALCQKNIKTAWINSYNDKVSVGIQLTSSATKDFALLTGNNIKKRLTIILNDRVVTSAIIQAPIDSGSIGAKVESLIKAEELKKSVLNNAPESPCGLIE